MSKRGSIVILCLIIAWLCLPQTTIYVSGNVAGSFEISAEPLTVTSFVPADGATGVIPDHNLVLTFDDNMVKGTGNIVIYKPGGTPFDTIDVNNAKVSISGSQVTINPNGVFASETAYYVQIAATCFEDTSANPYAGINDTTTWNFTTIAYTGRVDHNVAANVTDYTVEAIAAGIAVTVTTTATVTITILKYTSNPHPAVALPTGLLSDSFVDVMVDNPGAIVWPVYVKQTYTNAEVAGMVESSLGMYYFKDSSNAWTQCSDTGVDTAGNFVWAIMTQVELSGSPLIIGRLAVTAVSPPAISGGERDPVIYIESNFFGTTSTFPITITGEVLKTITATSEDGMTTFTIVEGTHFRDEDGNPLNYLEITIDEDPPPVPEGFTYVGQTYKVGPEGGTFNDLLSIEWRYDEMALPEGVTEESITLMCCCTGFEAHLMAAFETGHEEMDMDMDHEGMGSCPGMVCTVDTENNIVTGSCGHCTTFALFGQLTAVSPPPLPATFSVSDLSIQPAEVQAGESVTITLSVANTGDTEGSYTVALKINGVTEAEKIATIAAGSSQDVTFSVTKEDAGTYSVMVGGFSGSFTIVAPEEAKVVPPKPSPAPPPEEEKVVPPPKPAPPPPAEEGVGRTALTWVKDKVLLPGGGVNWPVAGGIIAAVVVIALFIIFRRRVSQTFEILFPRLPGG